MSDELACIVFVSPYLGRRGISIRKNGVDFEAHAAGISHQRGSWLACRREILLNFATILPKTPKIETYML
jgi:hypothetical protein